MSRLASGDYTTLKQETDGEIHTSPSEMSGDFGCQILISWFVGQEVANEIQCKDLGGALVVQYAHKLSMTNSLREVAPSMILCLQML